MIQRIKRFGTKCWRFVTFVLRQFVHNGGTSRAAALTFASLLAVVPLMSVIVTIVSAFPMIKSISDPIQTFIFQNFVPNTGKVVQAHLMTFAKQATSLSGWGLSILVLTAILLMFNIEESLNKTWNVFKRRRGVAAFLLYWAVLSLGPLLMGVSFILSSYLVSVPLLKSIGVSIGITETGILRWLPDLFAFVAFTLLYVVVPNTSVKVRHGMLGAVFAVILFEIAKECFKLYLTQFHTYQLIYGAFAAVPIFILWIYWVWVIVLLGAEVAHAWSAHYDRRLGAKMDPFTHAFNWLYEFWLAQLEGRTLTAEQLIDRDKVNYMVSPAELLSNLASAQLIRHAGQGRFILARDLNRVTLSDLHRQLPWQIPTAKQAKLYKKQGCKDYLAAMSKVEAAQHKHLETSLLDFYEN